MKIVSHFVLSKSLRAVAFKFKDSIIVPEPQFLMDKKKIGKSSCGRLFVYEMIATSINLCVFLRADVVSTSRLDR